MNYRITVNMVALFAALTFVIACTKNGSPGFADEMLPEFDSTAALTGNFRSNAHTTTGSVKVNTADGKRYLVFQNFRTDNGPDLRVWLSRNTGVNDYREVGPLRAVSGNFSYELGPNIDIARYNYVLIWCEDFSVLFGHAILQ